jgi:aspartyl-tRNA synthetase
MNHRGRFPPESRVAPRAMIGELAAQVGRHVRVCGWLSSQRRAKDIRFFSLRDRSGSVQVVHSFAHLDDAAAESALRVEGLVSPTPGGRYGDVEIRADLVDVVAPAQPAPLDLAHDPERRLDLRHLDLRKPEGFLALEVQMTFLAAARAFLADRGFLEIQTPKITAGGSESGAAVFRLDYFGNPACLVQSPQFYVQMAMAAGLDRVFEVGPVFRAEAVETHRHATEFTSLDVEVSWIEDHHELMALEEDLLRYTLCAVQEEHGARIQAAFGVGVESPDSHIPRIPYASALEIAGDAQDKQSGRMTFRAEQTLSKYCRDRHGHSFVFITDYPADERSFYTMQDEASEPYGFATTRSFDLLWRGLEITSGCQREHRPNRLAAQARRSGLDTDMLGRYLEPYYFPMFNHGCPPHGGFGLGLNRLAMALLGRKSIREVGFVFRGPDRFRP